MNLKYLLKKTINVKTSYLITIIIFIFLVITGCFSYAIFTVRNESKGALNIVTGNLFSLIESDDLDDNKSIIVNPGEIKTIKIKHTNVNGIDTKLNLYYSLSTESTNVSIGYLVGGDEAPTTTGYVLGKNGTSTDSKIIYVQIKNDDISPTTVTFGSNAGLSTSPLAFPTNKNSIVKIKNNHILKAYTYEETNEETKCITGEETTCVETDCFEDTNSNTCPMGTIIKYAVNNSEEKYFYVLHDDGETMTLQQRENTVRNGSWYSTKDDNTKGPLTILPLLETATSGWANVSNQTYTMGTTNFNNTNEFTGCSAVGTNVVCNTNTYTLPERTAKARMITAQEVISTGCQQNQEDGSADESCPIFMYNYLNQSTLHGGSVDDNADNGSGIYNFGYWTMSANSTDLTGVFHVFRKGFINKYISTATYGARAVIVISK